MVTSEGQEFQQAYILHVRKYTDSRIIVELFTLGCGRITGILRVPKKHTGITQSFRPVQVHWKGDKDLKTILSCEPDKGLPIGLEGVRLYCGIYLNELLQRLLPLDECYRELFLIYEKSLMALSQASSTQSIEPVLRRYEFFLLKELGFAINFNECINSGQPMSASSSYHYRCGQGFSLVANNSHGKELVVQGRDLIAISQDDYREVSTLKQAKQIARLALNILLGDKPLKSRELFL